MQNRHPRRRNGATCEFQSRRSSSCNYLMGIPWSAVFPEPAYEAGKQFSYLRHPNWLKLALRARSCFRSCLSKLHVFNRLPAFPNGNKPLLSSPTRLNAPCREIRIPLPVLLSEGSPPEINCQK